MWPASWGGSCNRGRTSRRGDELTDRIALWLAAVLILLIGADFLITGGATLLFLARKFLDLMDWVAFWR